MNLGLTDLLVLAIINVVIFFVLRPFLTGYAQERGRRLATHEDIEKLLAEVRLVTKETETLKAQIGGDLWERQNHWNARRDVYVRVLENLELTRSALFQARYAITRKDDVAADRAFSHAEALSKEFRRAMASAMLFTGPEVQQAWEKLSALDVLFGNLDQDITERLDKHLVAYAEFVEEVVAIARKDLKVP